MRVLASVLFAGLSLCAQAAEWNPKGANIFRLLRVDEPSALAEPMEHYRFEIRRLIDRLEAEKPEDLAAIRRQILSIEDILTDEIQLQLYNLLLEAVRNRRLFAVGPDGKTLNLEHADTELRPLLREIEGAGMAQLARMEGYEDILRELPELGSASASLEDHVLRFDEYLLSIGVSGFKEFFQKKQYSYQKKSRGGFFTKLKKNFALDTTGKWVSLTCAVGILASAGTYAYMRETTPPMPTAPQAVHQTLQDAANTSAQEAGQDAADFFRTTGS